MGKGKPMKYDDKFIAEVRLQVFTVLMQHDLFIRGPKELVYPLLNQNVDWVLGKYGTDKKKS